MFVSTMDVSVCLSLINKKIKMCQGVEVLRCHGVGINKIGETTNYIGKIKILANHLFEVLIL